MADIPWSHIPGSHPMNKGILADLKRIVGSEGATDQPDKMSRYIGDALGPYRAYAAASRLYTTPCAVVWPHDTQQVSRILRYAQRHQVPVVPYGGGSGVFGAAAAIEDGIVLSLDRMAAVLDLSAQDFTARFQSGVLLEDAARALVSANMLLGHDPWSRPIATIGGAISTDGVGYTAARYGSVGDQVLGVEAVLADGEIFHTRANPKSTNGISLEHLLIGTEGTFGIITEATLRAFPQPEQRLVAGIDFPTFEAGFHAICNLYAEGVRPTMIDFGTESSADARSPSDEEATLYIAFEGFEEDVKVQWTRTLDICRRYDGHEGAREEAARFWKTRHAPGERYKRNVLESDNPAKARREAASFRMDYLHVTLPISQVLEYRKRCMRLFMDRGVEVREWSIWARPEFFSFLIAQKDDEGEETSPNMERVVDDVLKLAHQMGGSMEYCHGVGLKLSHLMDAEHGSGLKVMRRLKRSIDPSNILNPGKLLG